MDARMEEIGWPRIPIDGHKFPGLEGRKGPHLRTYAYRGHLPSIEDDTGPA